MKAEQNPLEQWQLRAAQYQTLKTTRDNGLDASGIGHDLPDRLQQATEQISIYAAEFSRRCMNALHHELLTNVPCGITERQMSSVKLAEKVVARALAGFAGSLCHYGIDEAIELAADILEDVNAHPEAAELRAKLHQAEAV